MVAVKAFQAESFLAKPDPRLTAFLFYGPDAGLVTERAQSLAKRTAALENPPSEIQRFDDSSLEDDPDLLAVELQTVPMFGGRKVVRALTGRRINAKTLQPLIGLESLAGVLIVEAGNLRADEPLRSLFEKARNAAAIPCYADEDKDVAAVARKALAEAGFTIEPDALELLVESLGADRALSRREVEKVALYAAGRKAITVADVRAVAGDVSELALDAVAEAALSGDGARAIRDFQRAVEAGESAQAIIAAAQRQVLRLHRIRAALDQGASFEDAARRIRPPLHFKAKDAVSRQIRSWTGARLQDALSKVAAAAKAARLAGPLEETVAERLLLELARIARQSARGDLMP